MTPTAMTAKPRRIRKASEQLVHVREAKGAVERMCGSVDALSKRVEEKLSQARGARKND